MIIYIFLSLASRFLNKIRGLSYIFTGNCGNFGNPGVKFHILLATRRRLVATLATRRRLVATLATNWQPNMNVNNILVASWLPVAFEANQSHWLPLWKKGREE